jgi:hypothetical protein
MADVTIRPTKKYSMGKRVAHPTILAMTIACSGMIREGKLRKLMFNNVAEKS